MEEKKKSGKGGLIVLIILLLLALCCTCFYIVYDKVLNVDKTVETEKDTPKKNGLVSLEESDVASYLEKIHYLISYVIIKISKKN